MFHRNPNKRGSKLTSNKLTSIINNLFKAKVEEIQIADLTTRDAVVAVMGPTGTGKSTFIEVATGVEGKAGHTLESCTSQISVVKLSLPGVIDTDICFVDTPGFDDTRTSDAEIFQMIGDFMKETYQRQIYLSGLLYFHRITDNRMAGTPLRNLHMFEKLCGAKFNNIVLTTTMWDEVEKEVGQKREDQLKSEYWNTMIDRGSTVRRFHHDQKSAFDVLAPIINEVNSRSTLLLQKEMNELGLQLNQTTAGRTLYSELGDLVTRHQRYMERIRKELTEPTLDQEQLEVLMTDYKKVSDQLQRATEDLKKMKISVGDRIQLVARSVDWSRIFSIFSFKKKKKPLPQPTFVPEIFSRGSEAERTAGQDDASDGTGSDQDDDETASIRFTAQEKGKAVDRGNWAGAAHDPTTQQRDEGQEGMAVKEEAEAALRLQKEKEAQEARELIRQKEWQRKQELVQRQEIETREREREREQALSRERERIEREQALVRERERIEREKAEALERERERALAQERERERQRERIEREKAFAQQRERIERDKAEALERERQRERIEKEKAFAQQREREAREREARERERQRQEREREAREREEMARLAESKAKELARQRDKEVLSRRREMDDSSKAAVIRQDSRMQQRASDGSTAPPDRAIDGRRAKPKVADRASANMAPQVEQVRIERGGVIADEEPSREEREWTRAGLKREDPRQPEFVKRQGFLRQEVVPRQQEVVHQEPARQRGLPRQQEYPQAQEIPRQYELAKQKFVPKQDLSQVELARQEYGPQQEYLQQQEMARQVAKSKFVRQPESSQVDLARQAYARQQVYSQPDVVRTEWNRRQEEKARADDLTKHGRYRVEEERVARPDDWSERGSLVMQDELDRGPAERARGKAERERAKAERERLKEQARSYRDRQMD